MDQILSIMSTQLSEREVIYYLLIESGMASRDIAERLGVSHTGVLRVYKKAKAKMTEFGNLGLFQTPIL